VAGRYRIWRTRFFKQGNQENKKPESRLDQASTDQSSLQFITITSFSMSLPPNSNAMLIDAPIPSQPDNVETVDSRLLVIHLIL
jgi:hypothetical protein